MAFSRTMAFTNTDMVTSSNRSFHDTNCSTALAGRSSWRMIAIFRRCSASASGTACSCSSSTLPPRISQISVSTVRYLSSPSFSLHIRSALLSFSLGTVSKTGTNGLTI
ncbi:hypothetical protein Tcan_04935 [Toxocara canis]|uniref:Uncharacterized protein n=1 Tax=Toxocara canis TaxID=6265 RepID=A0A0B2V7G2_TOXCA|nr:hypothetical protein Tcan_04935 [Toxocara canis]